jgi:predicted  nucleic acid-binding Zn-ribbon protein
VLQKRAGGESGEYQRPGANGVAEVEAARAAHHPGAKAAEAGDERMSLFWRVFGGTILSMITLGAITLYNSISSNIAELRAELNREREARTELVRKDEFNSRTTTQYERIRSLDGLKADFEGLKERVSGNAAALDALKKEVAAGSDAAKKDAAALEVLKEKFAAAAADAKALRDEVVRVQKEQDRNQASDLERKASGDAQQKQIGETLKEVQKGLQDCREKLARLEAAREPKGAAGPAAGGGN